MTDLNSFNETGFLVVEDVIDPNRCDELRVEIDSFTVIRPLVLHASSKALRPSARRILHFLFGPEELRYGLHWADSV